MSPVVLHPPGQTPAVATPGQAVPAPKVLQVAPLPAEVKRCSGSTAPDCEFCRRREPDFGPLQEYVFPAWGPVSGCPNHIPPPPALAGTGTAYCAVAPSLPGADRV